MNTEDLVLSQQQNFARALRVARKAGFSVGIGNNSTSVTFRKAAPSKPYWNEAGEQVEVIYADFKHEGDDDLVRVRALVNLLQEQGVAAVWRGQWFNCIEVHPSLFGCHRRTQKEHDHSKTIEKGVVRRVTVRELDGVPTVV